MEFIFSLGRFYKISFDHIFGRKKRHMRHYILYNPFSGKKNGKKEAAALASRYEDAICRDMTKIEDYASFFSALSEQDDVILCGGDGTLNRFINETQDIDIPCDIRYFAIGSGNDFLRDVEKTADTEPFSIKEYIRELPNVTVNGKTHLFLNNVGFGIDGYCCEIGDEEKKRSDKPVNYTAIAIKGLLFHYHPRNAVVTVDGVEYRYEKVWLAPTMKGRFYGGGMMATPAQDRNDADGTLSLMLFHGSGKLKTLAVFPSIFKGTHIKHTEMVTVHTGKEISVVFESPAPVQIDGETIPNVTSYTATAKIHSLV